MSRQLTPDPGTPGAERRGRGESGEGEEEQQKMMIDEVAEMSKSVAKGNMEKKVKGSLSAQTMDPSNGPDAGAVATEMKTMEISIEIAINIS